MDKEQPAGKTNHNYYMCKRCGKKSAYMHKPTNKEYCRECHPRKLTKSPVLEVKPGVLSRLRGLLLGQR
jgi:ribosomal protein L37E